MRVNFSEGTSLAVLDYGFVKAQREAVSSNTTVT